MAESNAQIYLSSGEATEIRLGGTGDEKKVVKQEDILYVPMIIGYCDFQLTSRMELTTTFQKAISFSNVELPPVNVTNTNGTFTSLINGIWEFNLGRWYSNSNVNPTTPVRLYIQMKKNGVVVWNNDILIGAATANDEPSGRTLTTNRITGVDANDYYEFEFRAEMEGGGLSAGTVYLEGMEISAHKVYNKVA